MTWRDVVLDGLRRFSTRHGTRNIDRQQFLAEELAAMTEASNTTGQTPSQTVSRVLQELRDERIIEFLGSGSYVLLDRPFDIETTDLPDEGIDVALRANRLLLGIIETGNEEAITRRRRGQARLRALTLENYRTECAVCDVKDGRLLIASHILAWGAFPEHRGNLANVICLCRFHDTLFEFGYWGLRDDLSVAIRPQVESATITGLLTVMGRFRVPGDYAPSLEFIRVHRERAGLV